MSLLELEEIQYNFTTGQKERGFIRDKVGERGKNWRKTSVNMAQTYQGP